MLQKIVIRDFTSFNGKYFHELPISYQIFGKSLHEAPVVMVNHALTGNSTVCGNNGWWNGLVGKEKCIDTESYTIIAFDIPGNGYDGVEAHLFEDHKLFMARDIAELFSLALHQLKINQLYAVIGGSVGGGIAWELAALRPDLIKHLIPVATDWKSTDWLKANCLVQEQILMNSKDPVHDARLHAMLIYRSPESFKLKFNRSYNDDWDMYNVESWLLHHGKKLKGRFSLSAYKTVNHILANIDITMERVSFENVIKTLSSSIHLISVDSDIFFTAKEDRETYKRIKKIKNNVYHHIVTSVHGHDAFLIEFDQMENILNPIFKPNTQ